MGLSMVPRSMFGTSGKLVSDVPTVGRTRCGRAAVGTITDQAGAKVHVCIDHYFAMAGQEMRGFVFEVDVERIGGARDTCQLTISFAGDERIRLPTGT
jgi:hypothetical protein